MTKSQKKSAGQFLYGFADGLRGCPDTPGGEKVWRQGFEAALDFLEDQQDLGISVFEYLQDRLTDTRGRFHYPHD